MSDDRREIALRALRAAGHDQAAELVSAIIPAANPDPAVAPAAPAELTPGQAYAQQQQLAAGAAAGVAPGHPGGPPPPPGKAALADLDAWEALPPAERQERMAEANALLRSGAK
jgi:hypothetical protein